MTRFAATALAGAALALALLASCSDDTSSTAEDEPTVSSTPSGSSGDCPTGDPASWPEGVPTEIPLPDGSEIQSTDSQNGVQYIRFSIPLTFSDAVKLYLDELPARGFTLGTGDSESAEADIPFSDGDGQYSLKLSGESDPCQSQGLLAVGGDADSGDPDADDPDAE